MPFQTLKALIWGKTYPELSRRHTETVCTGAVLEDGTPIRLYPVPLRYLEGEKRFSLYDVVEVPAARNPSDPRPESYRVVSEHLERVEHLSTDGGTWRTRREWIFRDSAWQFDSVGALKRAQSASKRSMGLVTPGRIHGVKLVRKPAAARREFEAKMNSVQEQRDAFRPEYKKLQFLDHDVRLRWSCAGACGGCVKRPHEMKVLDWGLLELGRREGWEKAKAKLEEISDLSTHDSRLFLGNFRLHPATFGIIGMWYPKRRAQIELL